MFQKNKNHTLLTIICSSILVTATTPIKAWDWRHTVATGVGIATGALICLYKKSKNDIKRAERFVEKLIANQNKFVEHNEIILKNSKENPFIGSNKAPVIWQTLAKENGVQLLGYLFASSTKEDNTAYEIVIVSSGYVQYLVAHDVQKNTFGIFDRPVKEYITLIKKLDSKQQAELQHAKQA